MPNSQGAKGAEPPPPSTCTGRSAKREARGPERWRAGGSPSDPEGGGYDVRPPQKRKTLCSPTYFDHFEDPCEFGKSFSTFNMEWELLLFRAIFLTPKPVLPGLRWEILVSFARVFWGTQIIGKRLATHHLAMLGRPDSQSAKNI